MPRSVAAAFVVLIACVMTLVYLRGGQGFSLFAVSAAVGMAGHALDGWRGTAIASVLVFVTIMLA